MTQKLIQNWQKKNYIKPTELRKRSNNMKTINIFGKQFLTSRDALKAVIDYLEHYEPETIDDLDFVTFTGLATAFKFYHMRGLTDAVVNFFIESVLDDEDKQKNIDKIALTAWELADYCLGFESYHHAL